MENILDEILENTKKLMSYKTIKDNFLEFNEALEYVKEELKEYEIREIVIDNYKNLVISNTLDKNLDIIFCGHIDVVPKENYDIKISDNKLYGRGSFDMKSQLSVIISLLKHNKTDKKIAFIITSDEEIGGNCCKQIMKEYNSKLAVIPDGGKNFELIVEEKGLLQLELKMKGVTAHASEPYKGDNPILKLISIYEKLVSIYKMPNSEDEFLTSINLSKLNGGDAVNMVPHEAVMVLDIRFTKDDSIEKIINDIKTISTEVEINILDQGPVFQVDDNNHLIKNFINKTKDILNKELIIKKCVATSDAIYFSEKNIPTIIINPSGDYWHGPNEYVDINSLYTLYEIFKTLL